MEQVVLRWPGLKNKKNNNDATYELYVVGSVGFGNPFLNVHMIKHTVLKKTDKCLTLHLKLN
jgi:hypothetical protein